MSVEVEFHSIGTSPMNPYDKVDSIPQICYRCSSSIVGRPENLSELYRDQLVVALEERDEMWRKHEKAQISYLQDQNSLLLTRLHTEIERLHNINKDLERRLYVSTEPAREEIDRLQKEIQMEKEKNEELTENLNLAKKKNISLEQTFERTTNLYKEQLKLHEERIRSLNSELHDRTLSVTQLSTQLRNIKLREAIAQAQQRKRISCESPKQTSPTSAFRLFNTFTTDTNSKSYTVEIPTTSLLKNSATVTVLQPQQGSRPQFVGSSQSYVRRSTLQPSTSPRNNIEKPSIARSFSSGISPSSNRINMLASLRKNNGASSAQNL